MKRKFFVIVVVLISGLTILSITRISSQSQPKQYRVKLYSGGTVVSTWEALDLGNVDQQTLIFRVGDRKYPRSVRITGTYSIEELPQ